MLVDEETIRREYAPLELIADNYEKLLFRSTLIVYFDRNYQKLFIIIVRFSLCGQTYLLDYQVVCIPSSDV